MIHIALGTKAQVIKTAPVIWELTRQHEAFNLVDLGQHALLTRKLREEFNVPSPRLSLGGARNISTLPQAAVWLSGNLAKSLSSQWVRQKIFAGKRGVCLIHGDTVSTLLGLYLAKRAGLKVAHIEAGLRSFCVREPFPEEILRIVAMKHSDLLFAPSAWAYENLLKMGLGKKAVRLASNTGLETLHFSMAKPLDQEIPQEPFCLMSFHRMENIFSMRRLSQIVSLAERIADAMPLVLIQHEPTLRALKKRRLMGRLQDARKIRFLDILSHHHFVRLLQRCAMVVTDGGSIQEESCYLGRPCLLLRKYTERQDGLGENVVRSDFSTARIEYFLTHRESYIRPPQPYPGAAASETIVRCCKGLL